MYLEDGVWFDIFCSKQVHVWRFMKQPSSQSSKKPNNAMNSSVLFLKKILFMLVLLTLVNLMVDVYYL